MTPDVKGAGRMCVRRKCHLQARSSHWCDHATPRNSSGPEKTGWRKLYTNWAPEENCLNNKSTAADKFLRTKDQATTQKVNKRMLIYLITLILIYNWCRCSKWHKCRFGFETNSWQKSSCNPYSINSTGNELKTYIIISRLWWLENLVLF